MTLPLLLKFSQTDSMLELTFANIVPLRQEITTNLIAIQIEEDNIHVQFQQVVPYKHIIVASIIEIYQLQLRNADILDFLDQIDN